MLAAFLAAPHACMLECRQCDNQGLIFKQQERHCFSYLSINITCYSTTHQNMQGPNTNTSTMPFKQEFLKNLVLNLQQAHTSKHDASSSGAATNLRERKLAIKSSADVAMATARGATGGARWPKAILAAGACKVQRCRRITRRCRCRKRSFTRSGLTGGGSTGNGCEVARRLVRRRTMALREVIPGGRDAAVDEATLLREAMDYVVHLRAQVDVLRRVSRAVEISSITLQ